MADTVAAVPKVVKKKAVSKPKKPATHPKYTDMVCAAVQSLKERGGSSRQAILKYILANYNVGQDEKVVNQHLKISLRAGVKTGSLKQAKGTGASGSFRLGDSAKKAAAAAKPKKVTKPKEAKPKKVKATKKAEKSPKKAKSPAMKKVKKPKKAATPKKAAAKPKKAAAPAKPKKAAAKPKKAAAKPKKAAVKKPAKK